MMVDRLIADSWVGKRLFERVIANPTVDDFVVAFDALNARDHTLLCLEGRNGRELGIGGGDGKYVVYCAFSDSEFWNLISDPSASERVILNTGGQEGDFPARQVVALEPAKRAGMEFIRRAELDPSLRWELQA